MQRIAFVGRSLEDLKSFNHNARQETGYQPDQVQRGHEPADWKPMQSIGSGVQEIRIKDTCTVLPSNDPARQW